MKAEIAEDGSLNLTSENRLEKAKLARWAFDMPRSKQQTEDCYIPDMLTLKVTPSGVIYCNNKQPEKRKMCPYCGSNKRAGYILVDGDDKKSVVNRCLNCDTLSYAMFWNRIVVTKFK